MSPLEHPTLSLFDHDILGKDDKVGDGFVSEQRLARIAKLPSGCSVEERVLIFKRPPKACVLDPLASSPVLLPEEREARSVVPIKHLSINQPL